MPTAQYQNLIDQLRNADIELVITRKSVKNINFRIKPHRLNVSVPHHVPDSYVIQSISQRIEWAIKQHAIVLKRQKREYIDKSPINSIDTADLKLWGEPQSCVMAGNDVIEWYRCELNSVMPTLFEKWQPIVGKSANERRIKKMKTRWGSCNTKAKRIWLSVYLPAYPIECTEYVIVHELCHLHHANHSDEFWAEVKRAMPEYKQWHDMLAGKTGSMD